MHVEASQLLSALEMLWPNHYTHSLPPAMKYSQPACKSPLFQIEKLSPAQLKNWITGRLAVETGVSWEKCPCAPHNTDRAWTRAQWSRHCYDAGPGLLIPTTIFVREESCFLTHSLLWRRLPYGASDSDTARHRPPVWLTGWLASCLAGWLADGMDDCSIAGWLNLQCGCLSAWINSSTTTWSPKLQTVHVSTWFPLLLVSDHCFLPSSCAFEGTVASALPCGLFTSIRADSSANPAAPTTSCRLTRLWARCSPRSAAVVFVRVANSHPHRGWLQHNHVGPGLYSQQVTTSHNVQCTDAALCCAFHSIVSFMFLFCYPHYYYYYRWVGGLSQETISRYYWRCYYYYY